MDILHMLLVLVFCHLVGDYVLQSNFLATTKGSNWYHLFVHCALYCLPFFIVFGVMWQLACIFLTHLIIDSLKARYNKINYPVDQVLYYLVILVYFI